MFRPAFLCYSRRIALEKIRIFFSVNIYSLSVKRVHSLLIQSYVTYSNSFLRPGVGVYNSKTPCFWMGGLTSAQPFQSPSDVRLHARQPHLPVHQERLDSSRFTLVVGDLIMDWRPDFPSLPRNSSTPTAHDLRGTCLSR